MNSKLSNEFQPFQCCPTNCLSGWRRLDDRWGIAYWLEDTGLLHLRLDRPERALQLVGAAAALREQIGAPRPPAYDEQLDKRLLPARQALGEGATAAADETGRALDLDQAIDLALAFDSGA